MAVCKQIKRKQLTVLERVELDVVLRRLEFVMTSIHQDTKGANDTRKITVDHTEYFLEEALPAIMRTMLGRRFAIFCHYANLLKFQFQPNFTIK